MIAPGEFIFISSFPIMNETISRLGWLASLVISAHGSLIAVIISVATSIRKLVLGAGNCCSVPSPAAIGDYPGSRYFIVVYGNHAVTINVAISIPTRHGQFSFVIAVASRHALSSLQIPG